MIPKVLHFIWLGSRDCPLDLNKYQSIYKDYAIRLWRDNDIENLVKGTEFDKLYHTVPDKYMAKSDIARMIILNRFGGIYFDCDIVPIKKFDPWILDRESFGFYENEFYVNGQIANGVIGSVPKSRITRLYLSTILSYDLDKVSKLNYWNTFEYTGPNVLTYIYLKNKVWQFDVFPSRFVYAYTIFDRSYHANSIYAYEPNDDVKYEDKIENQCHYIIPEFDQEDITKRIKELIK